MPCLPWSQGLRIMAFQNPWKTNGWFTYSHHQFEERKSWSEPNLQGIMFQPLIFRGVNTNKHFSSKSAPNTKNSLAGWNSCGGSHLWHESGDSLGSSGLEAGQPSKFRGSTSPVEVWGSWNKPLLTSFFLAPSKRWFSRYGFRTNHHEY